MLRSFDGCRNVIGAVGLTTKQIKEFLDRQPWSQEIEDKYRGANGTNVVDRKALFDPEDEELRPKIMSEEERRELQEEVRVKNEEYRRQMEQDEKDGVDVAEKYSCMRVKSDYNLDPKS